MPVVGKQSDKPIDPKRIVNPLDRIVPVQKVVREGIKVSLYGRPKCLGQGTLILMYDGSIKDVEDVEPNDKLMGPDSLPRTVIEVSKGIGQLYKIIPIKGDSWVCNDEHILTLAGTCQMKDRVKDISVNQYLVDIENEIPWCHYWRLLRVGVTFAHKPNLPIPPYLVGLWLGDGHQGHSEIANSKKEIQEYCMQIAKEMNLVCKITPQNNTAIIAFSAEDESDGRWQGRPGRNRLRTFFREECSSGVTKCIPQYYLTSTRSQRRELLAGILDTDGRNTCVSATTVTVTGEAYRDGLLYLCRSIGLAAYSGATQIHLCKSGKVSTYYSISISGDLESVPTKVKKFAKRKQEKRVTVTGFDIEDIGNGGYFGFTLDGDGRFLLGDFTVTHNTGKTRLISTFPKPVLIIGSEDGTRSVMNVPDVDLLMLNRSDEIKQIVEAIKTDSIGRKYATVGLDTASRLNDMVLAEILGIEEIPVQKHWQMATRDQYGQCSLLLKTMLRELLSLSQNVVITAHERNFNDEGGTNSDLLTPTVGSALSASVCNWLNGAVEYVCQTFIRDKEEDVELSEGITTSMKTGRGEYCLRTGPHAAYMTGFRVPVGVELPDLIVNPSYSKIIKLVNGEPLTSNKPTTTFK